MLKSIGLLFLFSCISYFQISQLRKAKMTREIWIFSLLMLLVTGSAIAQVNEVPLPNPLELIAFIFKPIVG